MFPLVLEEHQEFTLTWNICRATCLRVNLVPVLHCLYLLQSVGQHLWDMHVWNSLTCSYGVQMSCSWLMLWFSWVAKSWFEFCEVHCVVHEKNWRSSRTRFCFAVFHFLTLFFSEFTAWTCSILNMCFASHWFCNPLLISNPAFTLEAHLHKDSTDMQCCFHSS